MHSTLFMKAWTTPFINRVVPFTADYFTLGSSCYPVVEQATLLHAFPRMSHLKPMRQLKVAHCMEVLHLDRKAHVEIKCVSWIEIFKELVKIFKARGLRIMLTDEIVWWEIVPCWLADLHNLSSWSSIHLFASSKYLCKSSTCLIVPVMEGFAVGWCLRCTEKALHNKPRRFRNPMVPLMGVIKLNGTCLASVTKISLSSSTHTPIGVEHDAPVDLPLEFPSFPVPATMMTCSPVALKWMAVYKHSTSPYATTWTLSRQWPVRCTTKR